MNYGSNMVSEDELSEDDYQNSSSVMSESSINTSEERHSPNFIGSGDNEASYKKQEERLRERKIIPPKIDPISVDWKVSKDRNSFDTGDYSFSYSKTGTEKSKTPSDTSFLARPWVAMIILSSFAIFFCYLFGLYSKYIDIINITSNAKKNCSDILEFNQLFPMEDPKFWRQIQVGIEHVQNDEPPEPAVFLLVYSERRTATNVLNRIVETVILCLDSKGGALTLPSSELQSKATIKDYGILIEKYRPVLEEKRVMIVRDVHTVPASVAPVFHVFCDTTGPVVKKSAIFFTMEMQEDEIPLTRNALYQSVEKRLETLWKNGVDKDKIQPLITRMTENVLHINVKK